MKITKEQRRKQENKKYKSFIRKGIKNIELIIEDPKFKERTSDLDLIFKQTQKNIDKASRKGIIHKNNGSRKIRKIFNMINSFKTKNS
ncbi:MAG TPA: 30S ribosomal protein S20 [Mycoplasmatales bacterium]|jgi:small subunit ribosomal protein S20|nr:30S ribosomal protein S20 [Mycoplasmatales bacterium]